MWAHIVQSTSANDIAELINQAYERASIVGIAKSVFKITRHLVCNKNILPDHLFITSLTVK